MTPRLGLVLAIIAAAGPGTGAVAALGAQNAPLLRLERPDAEFADPFTSVNGLRELSDGRVLVVDGQERRVVLLDFGRQAARPIGHEGAGPGEYAAPRALYRLRGDTSLLRDPGNGRYLVLLPNGEPGRTFSLPEGLVTAVTALHGVDAAGRFYLQTPLRGAREPFAGSGAEELLLRLDPGSGAMDTLARLALPPGREEGVMSLGGGMLRRLTNRPLAPEDVVAVGTNGRVGVVRAADYHVEWIDGSGRTVKGPPVPYDPIRITDGERRAALDALVVPGQILTRVGAGARSLPIPRGVTGGAGRNRALPPGLDEASMQWPTHKPPFLAGAATVAADGRLWVLRTRPYTDSIPTYDVFDASGRLATRVALPAHTTLAGFGQGTIYLARRDADDLLYLQRYRR